VTLPREQLQIVDVVRNAGVHRLSPLRREFVAVDDDLNLSRTKQVRLLVPLALTEFGAHSEVGSDASGKFDFEPRDLSGPVVSWKDVRTSAFLISSVKQPFVVVDLCENVGAKKTGRRAHRA